MSVRDLSLVPTGRVIRISLGHFLRICKVQPDWNNPIYCILRCDSRMHEHGWKAFSGHTIQWGSMSICTLKPLSWKQGDYKEQQLK